VRDNNDWISISDMMAGVMMIFLLITVSYIYVTEIDKQMLEEKNAKLKEANKKINDIATTYTSLQLNLNRALKSEFSVDLDKWNAEIDEENTLRFKEPEVYFDAGKSEVKERFKKILENFFPRYIEILSQPQFKEYIEDIRIEGHTSDEWNEASTIDERYIKNAELSQARALNVLRYCFSDTDIGEYKNWLIEVLRATGLSYAKPLPNEDASRRVEFKAVVKTKEKILEILDIAENIDSVSQSR
jgi:outer membrane protein OmpA-like peptidoglycan-associated protein